MAKQDHGTVKITPQIREALLALAGPLQSKAPSIYERVDYMDVGEVQYFTEKKQAIATSVARKQKDGTVDPEKTFDLLSIDVPVRTDSENTVETVTRVKRTA